MRPWKLYEGKEDRFQQSAFSILTSKKILAIHPPNERKFKTFKKKDGRTVSFEGMKLKASGVVKGASDLIILEPKGIYHGMIIELKAGLGSASHEQMDFLFRASENGYFTLLTWSIDEFIYYIDRYFQLDRMESIVPLPSEYVGVDGKVRERNWNRILIKKKSPK